MFILEFGQFGLKFCLDRVDNHRGCTVFFRQTESTDVPQRRTSVSFDLCRPLIGSMMYQSAAASPRGLIG